MADKGKGKAKVNHDPKPECGSLSFINACCIQESQADAPQDPGEEWVRLISCDGYSYMLKRKAAMVSVTLRHMLDADSNFSEASSNICVLNERGVIVEKLCEYLSYKCLYQNAPPKEDIPDFLERIQPEISLELLMAADYYDGVYPSAVSLSPANLPCCSMNVRSISRIRRS
ncbi:POZ domain-containing protein [Panus rudis PR-1116 ss-1]|nr:POZ domain-containing protein [Panus rudis PR-1116 ss-1]